MLLNLIGNTQQLIAFITAILLAITVHEFAHAWMADRLGDPTAKLNGRLTMNPLAHLDPIGTIFLFLVGFGWGKPVPINDNNLKNPKIDEVKISLAGPASNLIIAIILGLIIRIIPLGTEIINFLVYIILINLVLMTFNLLPIPPLDGSHILRLFLSENSYKSYSRLGIIILFIFILMNNFYPILNIIINWITYIFFNYIVGA